MTTASRPGAIFIASVFGAMALYFLLRGLLGAPLFPDAPWANYAGAAVVGLCALDAARIARHPERYANYRPSLFAKLFMWLEGLAYVAAGLWCVYWLIRWLLTGASVSPFWA